MAKVEWQSCFGSDLRNSWKYESLDDLKNEPAIYLWKRSIKAPQECQASEELFSEWLQNALRTPNAVISESKLNHCAQIKELRVGGGVLSEEKIQTLASLSQNTKGRKTLIGYIESLGNFFPPIYVGQTKQLRARVIDHLEGKTELDSYMKTIGLTFDDVSLEYCIIKGSNPPLELLEMTSQLLLSPFGTKRIG